MSSRFANKFMLPATGFRPSPDSDAGVYFDGDVLKVTRPANIEGDLTATAAVLNSVKLKGGSLVSAWWAVVATWNMGAMPGLVGSTNAVISTDVAVSGAEVGDLVVAAPIGSVALHVHWDAACYSANNVNLRARYTGSTGAYTPGNVPFKITTIKLA